MEFSRTGANSVTSCYPLTLFPHLGYLPKFWAWSLVVAGSCSGRKVDNSPNVIVLPMLFRGRGGDFMRTFLAGSGGFGLFRAVWVCRGGSGPWPARALAGLLGLVSCPLSAPCSGLAAWFARAGVRCLRSRWRLAVRHPARRVARLGDDEDGNRREFTCCRAAGCLTCARLGGRFQDWVASGEGCRCSGR